MTFRILFNYFLLNIIYLFYFYPIVIIIYTTDVRRQTHQEKYLYIVYLFIKILIFTFTSKNIYINIYYF